MAAFAKNLMRWTGKQLGGGGSSAESSAPPAVTPPPVTDTESLAKVAERRRRRMGLGAPPRGGTQLTGPAGLTTPATTERRTILGG